MKPRIIVCGLGRTGYKIYSLLKQQGAAVVGISDRPMPHHPSDNIIVGDLRTPTTLINAGIKDAHTLVLASSDDALNLAIVTQSRLLNRRLRIVNRLFNETLGERLDQTLPDHVSMSVYGLAAPIFSFAALGSKAIGQLRLHHQTWPIHEEIIHDNHPWLGLPLSELWDDPHRMLIYYLPARGEIDLVSAVIEGKRLQKGDHLIIGNKPTMRYKQRSRLRKMFKTLVSLTKYRQYVNNILVVSAAICTMIAVSTISYVSLNKKTSLVDAFYFSVGMVTGVGGQEQVVETAPETVKLVTAITMIFGAAIVGIFYALINDFVLGTRLKQFWDAARVPIRNHYIICGLGHIGMSIIRQLVMQGHEVVVIEKDPNNRFLNSARSLGVPVIVDDATLPGVLKAANLETANALLMVTSNDLANMEIALTAKAIAPRIPVVVRCQDPQLGQSAQEVFEFDTVLCPTELATPSFVAAALGGKILGNGMTDDLLWVSLATMITPRHPFCNNSIKQAAREIDFVPLYLERGKETIHSWDLLDTVLMSGDVLYMTIPATGLEQLWRLNSPEIGTPTFNQDSEINDAFQPQR